MANYIPNRVDEYGQRMEHAETQQSFLQSLKHSYITGVMHDCLKRGDGLPGSTVAFWKILEYLPFRRMDLQPDGSWKVIRW